MWGGGGNDEFMSKVNIHYSYTYKIHHCNKVTYYITDTNNYAKLHFKDKKNKLKLNTN